MRTGLGLVCAALVMSACGRFGFDNLDGDDTADPDAMGSEAPLPAGRWANVSMSSYAACGVTTTGELWCWGANWDNRLGIGEGTSSSLPPSRVDSRTDWAQVVVDYEHQCALDRAGGVWCWGVNRFGAVGTGPRDLIAPAPIRLDLAPARALAAHDYTTCAITTGGELWCWGRNWENQVTEVASEAEPPTQRDASTAWTAISIGQNHLCGLQGADLYCWGQDNAGQLGLGSTGSRDRPALVPVALGWSQVTSGVKHSCALTATGESYCWGAGWDGRLGTGYDDGEDVPTRTLAPVLASISSAFDHTCGLTATNDLYCWGYAGRGRVPGFEQRKLDPALVNVGVPVRQLALGGYATCVHDDASRMFCSGANAAGQLGVPAGEVLAMEQSDARTDWVEIEGSERHICGRTTSSGTWCWGAGSDGQLGDNGQIDRQEPVSAGDFDRIVTGFWTTLGTRGTELWLWGYDVQADAYHLTPELMNGDTLAMAQGANHGCWLVAGNELHCTGNNDQGQIGDGTTTWASEAVIPGTWRNVWAGESATCGTRDDGSTNPRLYCWGEAMTAGVGATDQLSPALSALPDLPVREVSFGQDFGCAIIGTGELWCWGVASWGRLGVGDDADHPEPVRVGTRSDWRTVDLGDWHACAVANDNTLWCWGHADQGQAGPLTGAVPVPIQLGGAEWTDVALTYHNTCALKTDGTRWCSGANEAGELGNGTSWSRTLVVVP